MLNRKTWFRFEEQFSHHLQNIQGKKQLEGSLGKNPDNYENVHNETNIYKQKPINVDDFNEVKKRKQKRRQVAKKTCRKKKEKRKHEEFKEKESDLWKRLSQLNSQFKQITKSKKDSKKMSDTIIKM